MNKSWVLLSAAVALAANLCAVETKFWQQDDESDFEKGSLRGVSLRSDGHLALAPAVSELFDASTPYLWTLARDSKGNLYAGSGGSDTSTARLYRIDASGKSSTLADLPGISIQAIAIDRNDRIYAATSPDGKVYEIAPGGKSSVFFDPKTKYIWALTFQGENLYVATGDPGQIFRVSPDGKSDIFFRTEEAHARSLAVDLKGNLIVGTDPGGLIIRVSPSGQGFVLYQASKSEVSSLAVAPNGDIFAAALGSKGAPPPAPPQPIPPVAPVPSPVATLNPSAVPHTAPSTLPVPSRQPPAPAGGSEVLRIEPDGSTRKVWTDPQALVYAIALDAAGQPLLGTGNRGIIYRIDSPILSTRLVDLAPTQVTAFCSGADGALYAATGNIGKVYRVGPGLAAEGAFESDVFDSGWFSQWGRFSLKPRPSNLRVWTRSGNLDRPQQDWSEWQAVTISGDSGVITSPPSRFLQYKLTLQGSDPVVSSVTIAYLPKNVAPEIQEIEITPPNYRFPPQMPGIPPNSQNINLPPLGARQRLLPGSTVELGSSSSMSYAKGYIGARWNAVDENGDTLVHKLEIRGVQEATWRPLKDKVKEKYFTFDSTAFPDGEYQIRVTASDEPSNPPAQALSASLVSDSFLIDNTPPQITGAAASGNVISWRAHDALTIISKAEYSIDGGEWRVVEPISKVSDSRDEDYKLALSGMTPGQHVMAIRVSDDYDNQAVAQVSLKTP